MLKFLPVLAIAVLLAAPGAYAQNSNQVSEEKDFVEEVVEDNNYEIALIEMALSKATDAELKMHASHMLADHKNTDSIFRDYAKRNSVSLKGTGAPAKVKISKDPGRDWDGEWAEEMVQKHRKIIGMFEQALTFTKEPELRDIINKTLPVLRSHLDMATELKNRLKG
jgi:putative membrane protein